MQALYERFDAFVTVCSGEAPGFAAHDPLAFWTNPNHFTAANVTGQPVLALSNGFSEDGLPVGLQLLGRPFDDATILRIGHAYQSVTDWHCRRPTLSDSASVPDVDSPPLTGGGADLTDRELLRRCAWAAERAGIPLDDQLMSQLLEGAPHALAMSARLARDSGYDEAPAAVFTVPDPRDPGTRGVTTGK